MSVNLCVGHKYNVDGKIPEMSLILSFHLWFKNRFVSDCRSDFNIVTQSRLLGLDCLLKATGGCQ